MKKSYLSALEKRAREIRLKVLETIYRTKKGHIGGTYSAIDMLIYLYYGEYGLNFDSFNCRMDNRDRLVMGKGHACLALYYIWADKNMIPHKWLDDFAKDGSYLSGQLNIDTPGVEYNTGSLGHAIGIAAGMAISSNLDNNPYLSIAFVGDGECLEGSIWESIEFAGNYKIKNLLCIIDFNRLGVIDFTNHSKSVEILQEKIKLFGWDCEIIDGHNFEKINLYFKKIRLSKTLTRPHMIIMNTVKGKGVSFMENGIKWHHTIPSSEEYVKAKKELGEQCA